MRQAGCDTPLIDERRWLLRRGEIDCCDCNYGGSK